MRLSDSTERIMMSHGGGGKRARDLLTGEFLPVLTDESLRELGDAAVVEGAERLAFTTDSFVVKPIFFPGGDIGRLAVCGTVNDLAVMGATPLYMSLGLIIEEGLLFEDLRKIIASVKATADEAGVRVVCGDTKVVERGSADGIFINTSGVGSLDAGIELSPKNIQLGDAVIVSGTLGDHSIAVMSAREGIEFETDVVSDVRPLGGLARAVLEAADVRCMRDPTRGGVAGVVCELAESAGVSIELEEKSIPVSRGVKGACDILGLDPIYAANEGKFVAIVSCPTQQSALDALRSHPHGRDASIIGVVTDDHPGRVVMRTALGGRRIVDMPLGEQLPRIC